jgi:acetyl esterase
MQANGEGLFLTADAMRWFWDQYVPADRRLEPYAVPARAADLSGLAPAFVAVAEYDPLRDEGVRYAERLGEAGVDTNLVCYPGVVHGFMSSSHIASRAEQAHDDLARALRRALT